eukprot:TRINITY_DN203_c0_g3_i1.p1 TRINITY_DN203_c0_g3~~TRINITY_DN203_c0_g3_i1.p1  ORF type:complete len:419 (-),score=63.67 TRINITY_DN203_c0_g3_i1:58-1314(-)
MFERMLDVPYNVQNVDVALAPPRQLIYKSLLVANLNLNGISEAEKKALATLEFDLFPYKEADNEDVLFALLMVMFYELKLPEIFKIAEKTLYRFLRTICFRYRSVPFHNFFHAFNVTQTLYFFLITCNAAKLFTPIEHLCMIIGTLCHDIDHPGLNNDFQKKAQTRISQLHQKSALENHHFLQAICILSKRECNILSNLSSDDQERVWTMVRHLIMATDLAVHGIVLKNLSAKAKTYNKLFKAVLANPIFKPNLSEEDTILLMCTLIKCSDISNEIRKPELAWKWAKLVLQEFFAQAAKEKSMNLKVTPWMDASKIIVAKEQMNFISNLCLPLYTQAAIVFPAIQQCCQQLNSNKGYWNDRLNSYYSDGETKKKLQEKSIWERNQAKAEGKSFLTFLAARSSNVASKKPPTAPTPGKK